MLVETIMKPVFFVTSWIWLPLSSIAWAIKTSPYLSFKYTRMFSKKTVEVWVQDIVTFSTGSELVGTTKGELLGNEGFCCLLNHTLQRLLLCFGSEQCRQVFVDLQLVGEWGPKQIVHKLLRFKKLKRAFRSNEMYFEQK